MNHQLIRIDLVVIVCTCHRLGRITTLSSVVASSCIALLLIGSDVAVPSIGRTCMLPLHLVVIQIGIVARHVSMGCTTVLDRARSLGLDHSIASLITHILISLYGLGVEVASRVLLLVGGSLIVSTRTTRLHHCLALGLGLRVVGTTLSTLRGGSYLTV